MESKTQLYSRLKIWRLYVVLRQKAAISISGSGSIGVRDSENTKLLPELQQTLTVVNTK